LNGSRLCRWWHPASPPSCAWRSRGASELFRCASRIFLFRRASRIFLFRRASSGMPWACHGLTLPLDQNQTAQISYYSNNIPQHTFIYYFTVLVHHFLSSYLTTLATR
jgi:hypothetical protein